jgi:hypothetical protein
MRKSLEGRLQRIETTLSRSAVFQVWVREGATLRGPRGEHLTQEEVDVLGKRGGTIIIIDEVDAQL